MTKLFLFSCTNHEIERKRRKNKKFKQIQISFQVIQLQRTDQKKKKDRNNECRRIDNLFKS